MSKFWDDPLSTTSNSASKDTDSTAKDSGKSKPVAGAPDVEGALSKVTATTVAHTPPASSSIQPVKAENKRVVNGETDVNQLAPFKYPWAWKFFINANKNQWSPLDIKLHQDVLDYNNTLNDDEKHVYKNVMSYLTTSGILAMRNIGLGLMEKMTAPELQIYQARQIYEEALHTSAYQQCIEAIGLDQGELYNRYRLIPEIDQKIQMTNRHLSTVMRPDIDLNDKAELENFTMAYLFFSAVFEGCWLYHGFSPIFSLQRRGLMKGTAEQLQFIMRDKAMHCAFGIRAVRQIIEENNVKLDPVKIRNMWDEAEAVESKYVNFLFKNPIQGYSAEEHMEQHRYLANQRARELGLQQPFPGAQCALPWLDKQANPTNETDHHDANANEHEGGSLSWD